MRRARRGIPVAAAVLGVVAASATAWGVIQVLYPLQKLLDDADFIFRCEVDSVDPERPAMVLVWKEDLKGKPAFDRLPVNLTGDKEKHTPKLLRRVAPKLPIVCFVKRQDAKNAMMLAYTNGTWFQVLGTTEGGTTRWAFTHCEIYMRRTFRGTTAELETAVKDVLAGKAKAPAPDTKAPAGFGPEVDAAE